MMPLILASEGDENIIRKIGGSPEVKKHLENLGFVVGGNVKVVTTVNGNLIVNVVKLHGEGAIKRRIMDMGLTKGVEVYVRKVAPLGDPVEVTVRGYELSLRKADAEMVEVE